MTRTVTEVTIHEEGFMPKRRGRRPMTMITDLVENLQRNPNVWVSKTYPEPEAASVIRQIKSKYDNIEVASIKDDGRRTVYIRFIDNE